ncbi:MAG: hypothetical protein IH958_02285 [Chloroflexi bacterium]|nr:hypothetical protein [Chloroflexota bacterium]
MRRLIWLLPLGALIVVAAVQAPGFSLPDTAHAQEASGGMSLAVKNDCDDTAELSQVEAGEPFVVCISADPAPTTRDVGQGQVEPVQGISGFATEVLFDDGLRHQRRDRCEDEVKVRRVDDGGFAFCQSFVTSLLGGAGHAVFTEFAEPPVAPLDLSPGSTALLVEMDFTCILGGSYTLTLTAVPDSSFGGTYGDVDGFEFALRTVGFDYDGDTVPNQVADFVTLDCSGPTATPCPASGCPTATVPPPPTPFPLDTPESLTATADALATAGTPSDGGDDGVLGSRDTDDGGASVWLWVGLGVAAAVLASGAAFEGYRRYSRSQRG